MFNNHFIKFIKKYPKKIDWTNIVAQENLTPKFIIENQGKFSNIGVILFHQCVSVEYIISCCERVHPSSTEWKSISMNPNWNFTDQIHLEFLEKNINKLYCDILSMNKTLTIDFLEKHREKNWNWELLIYHESLPQDLIDEWFLESFFKYGAVSWSRISCCYVLSEKIIDEYADKVDWYNISKFHRLTTEFMKKYWNKFSVCSLMENKTLTKDLIDENIEKIMEIPAMYRSKILRLPCTTLDLIEKYFVESKSYLSWQEISSNPNLTLEFVEKNYDKMNWEQLSYNCYLNVDIVRKYFDKLNYQPLIHNKFLDFELIERIAQKGLIFGYNPYFWKNPLNLDPFVLNYHKKRYSQALETEIPLEILRRENIIIAKNKNIYNLCIHEIKLNIRDTKLGTICI